MSNSKKLSRFSSIFSGLGVGLMLGLIVGMSVSPTVKTVVGAITAILASLLGFGDKFIAGAKDIETEREKNLWKTGAFGFAVVLGLVSGTFMRTNNWLAPSISESVQEWIDAGYDEESAKKYVAFQRLGIDPESGEVTEITEIQKASTGGLFSGELSESLETYLDPDKYNNDFESAILEISVLNNKELDAVLQSINSMFSDDIKFEALRQLHHLIIIQEKTNKYCDIAEDNLEWEDSELLKFSNLFVEHELETRTTFIKQLQALFCSIPQKK